MRSSEAPGGVPGIRDEDVLEEADAHATNGVEGEAVLAERSSCVFASLNGERRHLEEEPPKDGHQGVDEDAVVLGVVHDFVEPDGVLADAVARASMDLAGADEVRHRSSASHGDLGGEQALKTFEHAS